MRTAILGLLLLLGRLPAGAQSPEKEFQQSLDQGSGESRSAAQDIKGGSVSDRASRMRESLTQDAAFQEFVRSKGARLEEDDQGGVRVKARAWKTGDEVQVPLSDAFERFAESKRSEPGSLKTAAANCSPAGSACRWSLDCCGASRCRNGICEGTDGNNCAPAGGMCNSSLDCCAGFCRNSICGGVGGDSCVSAGGRCNGSGDCCSGFCSKGICGGVGDNCVAAGGRCNGSGDCCSGFCSNGVCGGVGNNCSPPGGGCNNSVDCCGGFCSNKICSGGGCVGVGGRCNSPMDCCAGATCNEGLCSGSRPVDPKPPGDSGPGAPPAPSCHPQNGSCARSSDCCAVEGADSCARRSPPCLEAVCGGQRCLGVWRMPEPAQCVPAGGACSREEQCCKAQASCRDQKAPCTREYCMQGKCLNVWSP